MIKCKTWLSDFAPANLLAFIDAIGKAMAKQRVMHDARPLTAA